MNASLISIRPRFVDAIFRGEKGVELRRAEPRFEAGHLLFVYESSPTMAVRGVVSVAAIEVRSAGGLWRRVRNSASLSRSEYRAYFAGRPHAVAIHLEEPRAFATPLSLSTIRLRSPLFHPPRTWVSIAALPLPLQCDLLDALREAGPRPARISDQKRPGLGAM